MVVMTNGDTGQGDATYRGHIKSWNPEKGWGFIESLQTHELYGKDVFLLRSDLGNENALPEKGEEVYFVVTDRGRGPQATNVTLGSADVGVGPTYTGTVKSFSVEKGYGHIKCEETEATMGKDVFFMKSQVPKGNISPGTEVIFFLRDGAKGAEAYKVQISKQQKRVPLHHGNGAYDIMNNLSKVFQGTIKSWDEAKGYGHIDCAETRGIYGKDMFLLKSALKDQGMPTPGDSIAFSVGMGQKGVEAVQVSLRGQFNQFNQFDQCKGKGDGKPSLFKRAVERTGNGKGKGWGKNWAGAGDDWTMVTPAMWDYAMGMRSSPY